MQLKSIQIILKHGFIEGVYSEIDIHAGQLII